SCFLDGNNRRKRYPRAELCFLALFQSWHLNEGKQYRLTWYSSWSPYPDCVPKLVEFLGDNSNVSLRIFAAGIHSIFTGYKRELRNLRDAGAQLAIMTLEGQQELLRWELGRQGGWEMATWRWQNENPGGDACQLPAGELLGLERMESPGGESSGERWGPGKGGGGSLFHQDPGPSW
ncbi:Putative DNA dC-_dU-editing enzyme APOBEC-3A, partial [Myotis brandtii]